MSLPPAQDRSMHMSHPATTRAQLAELRPLRAFFAALLLLLAGAGNFAVAQDIFGRILGTVTDSSGGAVPMVKVTITNEATQVPRIVAADKNGYYVADDLSVGTYTVTAGHQGFKTITKIGNVVVAGGHLTVDLRLEVGAVTETVQVKATGDTVNTTSGEISTTIDFQQVQDIALNERHYETLVTLIPGAQINITAPTSPLAESIQTTALPFFHRHPRSRYAVHSSQAGPSVQRLGMGLRRPHQARQVILLWWPGMEAASRASKPHHSDASHPSRNARRLQRHPSRRSGPATNSEGTDAQNPDKYPPGLYHHQ